jgi:hypothetical protein
MALEHKKGKYNPAEEKDKEDQLEQTLLKNTSIPEVRRKKYLEHLKLRMRTA